MDTNNVERCMYLISLIREKIISFILRYCDISRNRIVKSLPSQYQQQFYHTLLKFEILFNVTKMQPNENDRMNVTGLGNEELQDKSFDLCI